MLWYEKGGSGTRAILLLHGLGATSGVWTGVQRVLDERGMGRWLSPDLSGHGRSDVLAQYSVGSLAAELASLVQGESELFVIGHSLGAYLGLALASRWFANIDEAWNRYRRVSGLDTRVAPGEQWLRHGVTHSPQGWRLSQDSRTFQVAGAPFDSLVSSAKARIVLARGEQDTMVSTSELETYCPGAREITAAGHNAHVERPDEIVR